MGYFDRVIKPTYEVHLRIDWHTHRTHLIFWLADIVAHLLGSFADGLVNLWVSTDTVYRLTDIHYWATYGVHPRKDWHTHGIHLIVWLSDILAY
jgi:hypothetical protein